MNLGNSSALITKPEPVPIFPVYEVHLAYSLLLIIKAIQKASHIRTIQNKKSAHIFSLLLFGERGLLRGRAVALSLDDTCGIDSQPLLGMKFTLESLGAGTQERANSGNLFPIQLVVADLIPQSAPN